MNDSLIRRLNNNFVNLYLIIDPDGLTVIDTGLARSGPKLVLKAIAGLGRQPSDLKRILITHADPDHTGGAAELKAKTGATIFASKIEAEAIEAGVTSREVQGNALMKALFAVMGKVMMPLAPAQVDEVITPGQILPVLGGLQVIATPGHTPGHVSFYAPAHHILIAGDSLNASSGALKFDPAPVHWDYAQGRESAKREAALGATTVCCGHGNVIEGAPVMFPI
jgi:glyoxylase-like metal-dependent hydrolase (beta-lactamase superfamily II)